MSLSILSPGSLATLQDLGRFGYQASGFSPSGAMDAEALRVLNALLGNDLGEAAIEMTAQGMMATFNADCVFALTGADNHPVLNGQPVPMYQAVCAKKGDELNCGFPAGGFRTYLGVAGGFDVPLVMGSRSTGMKFSVGGFHGRKLQSGDKIGFAKRIPLLPKMETRKLSKPEFCHDVTLRVVMGPQDDCFSEAAKSDFLTNIYTVTNSLDRMGIRLDGDPVLSYAGYDIISDATATGSIQIVNDGKPIILMVDRQTTGGYTKIATVISVDLPLAGQLCPGCTVRFRSVTVEEAQKLYSRHLKSLRKMARKWRQ